MQHHAYPQGQMPYPYPHMMQQPQRQYGLPQQQTFNQELYPARMAVASGTAIQQGMQVGVSPYQRQLHKGGVPLKYAQQQQLRQAQGPGPVPPPAQPTPPPPDVFLNLIAGAVARPAPEPSGFDDDDGFQDFEAAPAALQGIVTAAAAIAAAPHGVSRDKPLDLGLFGDEDADSSGPTPEPTAQAAFQPHGATAANIYEKGEEVLYTMRDGSLAKAKVMSVDKSIVPYSYGIMLEGGSERETEAHRLQRPGVHCLAAAGGGAAASAASSSVPRSNGFAAPASVDEFTDFTAAPWAPPSSSLPAAPAIPHYTCDDFGSFTGVPEASAPGIPPILLSVAYRAASGSSGAAATTALPTMQGKMELLGMAGVVAPEDDFGSFTSADTRSAIAGGELGLSSAGPLSEDLFAIPEPTPASDAACAAAAVPTEPAEEVEFGDFEDPIPSSAAAGHAGVASGYACDATGQEPPLQGRSGWPWGPAASGPPTLGGPLLEDIFAEPTPAPAPGPGSAHGVALAWSE